MKDEEVKTETNSKVDESVPVNAEGRPLNFWERKTKCRNHPTKIATADSVKLGDPLCWNCDPLWTREKAAAKKAKYKYQRKPPKFAGARSDKLPSGIASLYEIAITDVKLVSLREDIATWEAIIQQIGLDLKQSPWDNRSFFKIFWENWDRWAKQVKAGSMSIDTLVERVENLKSTIVPKTLLMSELLEASEMKRKLVDSETSRMAKLGYDLAFVMRVLGRQSQLIAKYLSPADMERYKIELRHDPIINGNEQFQLLPVNHEQLSTEEKLRILETQDYEGVFRVVKLEEEKEDATGEDC